MIQGLEGRSSTNSDIADILEALNERITELDNTIRSLIESGAIKP